MAQIDGKAIRGNMEGDKIIGMMGLIKGVTIKVKIEETDHHKGELIMVHPREEIREDPELPD